MKKVRNVFLLGDGAKVLDKPLDLSSVKWNKVPVYLGDKEVGVCFPFLISLEGKHEINTDLYLVIDEDKLAMYVQPEVTTDGENIMISKVHLISEHPNKDVMSLKEYRLTDRKMSEIDNAIKSMNAKGWSPRRISRVIKNME